MNPQLPFKNQIISIYQNGNFLVSSTTNNAKNCKINGDVYIKKIYIWFCI